MHTDKSNSMALSWAMGGFQFARFFRSACIRVHRLVCLAVLMSITCTLDASPTLELEYVGLAVKREETHVWGSSPVIGPDGKVHLYVAQWPRPVGDRFGGKTRDGKVTGWTSSSEIAHYVGDRPEGPFTFLRLAVPDQGGLLNAPHNPTIQHIDGKSVLSCIVNTDGTSATQRILMFVADDLNDQWRPVAGAEADGTILRKSEDPSFWDHQANRGVSNPSLIKHQGKYLLYFKAVIPLPEGVQGEPWQKGHTWTYGVAIADKLEGPYRKQPGRITDTYAPIEDACLFSYNDRVWMLSRDMNGKMGGGGLLWVSEDGMRFDEAKAQLGFHHLDHYIGKERAAAMKVYRGVPEGHLERPQVLFVDGKPAYLYLASGLGFPAPYGSASHVFRMKWKQ